jgi:hypothetical protein
MACRPRRIRPRVFATKSWRRVRRLARCISVRPSTPFGTGAMGGRSARALRRNRTAYSVRCVALRWRLCCVLDLLERVARLGSFPRDVTIGVVVATGRRVRYEGGDRRPRSAARAPLAHATHHAARQPRVGPTGQRRARHVPVHRASDVRVRAAELADWHGPSARCRHPSVRRRGSAVAKPRAREDVRPALRHAATRGCGCRACSEHSRAADAQPFGPVSQGRARGRRRRLRRAWRAGAAREHVLRGRRAAGSTGLSRIGVPHADHHAGAALQQRGVLVLGAERVQSAAQAAPRRGGGGTCERERRARPAVAGRGIGGCYVLHDQVRWQARPRPQIVEGARNDGVGGRGPRRAYS